MLKMLHTIGCAADAEDLRYATRLAISGNESHGGGSATETDEETDEEKALREQDEDDAILDDDDDQSKRSSRQDRAYDELKSDRDRLRNDLEAQKRENQEFRERLTRIEGEQSEREKTNERTNTALERAEKRAKEIADAIARIDPNDPDRTVKVYTEVLKPYYEDVPKIAEEIGARTARETVRHERTLDEQREDAKEATLAALQKAGLDEEDFELVQALAISKQQLDPDWFKRVKPEEQIGKLVQQVKERIVKTTRHSREFQEEKDRHRRPMSGVIENSSRSTRRREVDEDEDQAEGPGSMLADLQRAKEAKRTSTKGMIRQADFGR